MQVFGRDTEALAEHLEPGDLVKSRGTLGHGQTTGPDVPGKAQRAAQLAVSTFSVEVWARAPVPATTN